NSAGRCRVTAAAAARRGAAAKRGNSFAVCRVRAVSGSRDYLVFLELSLHRCIDPAFLRDPDVRDEYADQHSTQIANDYSRDCPGRDVREHVDVQAVLHLSLAAAAGSVGGSQL